MATDRTGLTAAAAADIMSAAIVITGDYTAAVEG
jgi:hypothetical protein